MAAAVTASRANRVVVGYVSDSTEYDALKIALDEIFEQEIKNVLRKQEDVFTPYISDPSQFKLAHPGSSIERTLPLKYYIHREKEDGSLQTYLPELDKNKHVVTWSEMLLINHLQSLGVSKQQIEQELKKSLPRPRSRMGKEATYKACNNQDAAAFRIRHSHNVADDNVKIDAIMKEALHLRDKMKDLCKGKEKDSKVLRDVLKQKSHSVNKHRAKEDGNNFIGNGSPRYICLAGNSNQNDDVRTCTCIKSTTNPILFIKSMNALPDSQNKWYPCLYIYVPTNINNYMLKNILKSWQINSRRIVGRTIMGIAISCSIGGRWFISKNLQKDLPWLFT